MVVTWSTPLSPYNAEVKIKYVYASSSTYSCMCKGGAVSTELDHIEHLVLASEEAGITRSGSLRGTLPVRTNSQHTASPLLRLRMETVPHVP